MQQYNITGMPATYSVNMYVHIYNILIAEKRLSTLFFLPGHFRIFKRYKHLQNKFPIFHNIENVAFKDNR